MTFLSSVEARPGTDYGSGFTPVTVDALVDVDAVEGVAMPRSMSFPAVAKVRIESWLSLSVTHTNVGC